MDAITLLLKMDTTCPVKCDVCLFLGPRRSLELRWHIKVRRPELKEFNYSHCFTSEALKDVGGAMFELEAIRETMKKELKI